MIFFFFLRGLVKSFPYHDMRKRRGFLAFSPDLVCQQELCSETVGCRDPPITLAQGRSIVGSSRTWLHPAGTGHLVLLGFLLAYFLSL